MRRITRSNVKNILVVKLNYLGDVIQFFPVLENLRMYFSNAHILLLTTRIGEEITRSQGVVDEVMVFEPDDIKKPKGFLKAFLQLRRRSFDIAITSQDTSSYVALLLLLCGIPVRVGFSSAKAGFLYNICIRTGSRHACIKDLGVLERIGVGRVPLRRPNFRLSGKLLSKMKEVLKEGRTFEEALFIGIHPGSKRRNRRWSISRFIELAEKIDDFCRANIVLLGTSQEEKLASDFISGFGEERVINLVGRTTVTELFHIVACLDLLICHDSGVMHVAFMVGTPTVSLWGPGSPEVWGPAWEHNKHSLVVTDSECRGCEDKKDRCRYGETPLCMERISVDKVFAAVKERIRGD